MVLMWQQTDFWWCSRLQRDLGWNGNVFKADLTIFPNVVQVLTLLSTLLLVILFIILLVFSIVVTKLSTWHYLLPYATTTVTIVLLLEKQYCLPANCSPSPLPWQLWEQVELISPTFFLLSFKSQLSFVWIVGKRQFWIKWSIGVRVWRFY